MDGVCPIVYCGGWRSCYKEDGGGEGERSVRECQRKDGLHYCMRTSYQTIRYDARSIELHGVDGKKREPESGARSSLSIDSIGEAEDRVGALFSQKKKK